MITLHYIGGNHDGLGTRVIRFAQRHYSQPSRSVTHTEALLGGGPNDAIIGSSSLVDEPGGVRVKRDVVLNPLHWLVLDLPDTPERNARVAARWFAEHDGAPYDRLGAAGSVGQALFGHRKGGWYCTEAVASAMGFRDPHAYPPAGFYNLLLDMGAVDITERFFGRSP